MPVMVASKLLSPVRIGRAAAGGIVLAVAATVGVATLSRADLATSLGDAAEAAVNNVKTVAAMLADRSPGQRPKGALASLKHKRAPLLHERALPKVRQPESPLLGIVGTPPIPPVEAAPTTPLYSMVAAPTELLPPVSIVPAGPVGPPANTPPSGGGIIVPPVTPTETPTVPVTPAVPEPNTWAMMLLGFALVGWAVRRDRRQTAHIVSA